MTPWVVKEKMGTLLLASEMPVPIPRCSTVVTDQSGMKVTKRVEARSRPCRKFEHILITDPRLLVGKRADIYISSEPQEPACAQ